MTNRIAIVKRGVIQCDISSPICVLVAPDNTMTEYGGLVTTIQLNDYLLLSEHLFADDAALPNNETTIASRRFTRLDKKVLVEADIEIDEATSCI